MDRQQAHQLLDRLAPAQFSAVAQLLEVLATGPEPLLQSLSQAPVEEEEITAETAAALDRARSSLARGPGIPHEEILREFGLTKGVRTPRPSGSPLSGPRKPGPISAPSTAKPQCRFFTCLDRYLTSRSGDVKKLKPPRTDFRLRCGDYRLFFEPKGDNAIEITGVLNRREANR